MVGRWAGGTSDSPDGANDQPDGPTASRGAPRDDRIDYMSDPREGDADYAVDLIDSYHGETPLSAAGGVVLSGSV